MFLNHSLLRHTHELNIEGKKERDEKLRFFCCLLLARAICSYSTADFIVMQIHQCSSFERWLLQAAEFLAFHSIWVVRVDVEDFRVEDFFVDFLLEGRWRIGLCEKFPWRSFFDENVINSLSNSPAAHFARPPPSSSWAAPRWFSSAASACHRISLALLDCVSSTFASLSKFLQLFHFPATLTLTVAPTLILARHVSTPFLACRWSFVRICETTEQKC